MRKTALLAIGINVLEIRSVVLTREYVARRIVAAHITMISDRNQPRHEVGRDSVHHWCTISCVAAHSLNHAAPRLVEAVSLPREEHGAARSKADRSACTPPSAVWPLGGRPNSPGASRGNPSCKDPRWHLDGELRVQTGRGQDSMATC